MSTREKTIYEQHRRNLTLRERALAALAKEEADKAAAEEAYRAGQERRAEDDLKEAVSLALTNGQQPARAGVTYNVIWRDGYESPAILVDGCYFYVNATRGLLTNDRLPQDYLWAAILCSRCGQTAASIQVTPAHAGHDPMADLGRLFEQAGDPPLCGVCGPQCQGCLFGDPDEHTCLPCDWCSTRHAGGPEQCPEDA